MRAAELVGLKLTDIDDDSLTVNQSVWHGKAQSPKTDTAMRTLALSWQLVSRIDALRVALKTIQERFGHALTGSFTLDVYGGKPDGSGM